MPESSINYESRRHDKALNWSLNDFQVLQIDASSHRKQDIFLLHSEVYFENKWSTSEINSDGRYFVEFTPG